MRINEVALKDVGSQLAGSLQLYVPRPKDRKLQEVLKPTSGFMYSVNWTSTAIKTDNGYTSEWVEWCRDEMPHWLTETGILYKVKPGANILSMNTDSDAVRIAKHYGVKTGKTKFDLSWTKNFPWDEIEDDFDAVHYTPTSSSGILMTGWDVESTGWFNSNFLTNLGEVSVAL